MEMERAESREGKKSGRMIKAIAVMLSIAAIFVIMSITVGCKKREGNGAIGEKEEKETLWIGIENEVTEYDGEKHGVKLIGTEEGDKIEYSKYGFNWQAEAIEYTEVGEYEVYVRVERVGYNEYQGVGKIVIKYKELKGITAEPTTVIYDGEAHGIRIDGIEEGDEVNYSLDGETYEESVELTEVGEYRVYYKVVRDRTGCKIDWTIVTILPRIAGRYINKENGIKELNESEIEYDVNGLGIMQDGTEFKVEGEKLTVGGTTYEKIKENEKVYVIKICGGEIYIASGAEIEIEICDGAVKVNGSEAAKTGAYNYCESVKGREIERDYENNTVTLTVGSDGEITEVEIDMTERLEREIDSIEYKYIYDGQAKAIGEDGIKILTENGVEETKEYREIGEYVDRAVVESEGYLPTVTEMKVTILPDLSGAYYRADGIIEIDRAECKVNGREKTLEYGIDGKGEIGGQAFETTENGITYDGEEYEKRINEKIIAIVLNDDVTVLSGIDEDIYIQSDENGLRILNDAWEEIAAWEPVSGIELVTVNGEECEGVDDNGTMLYIFGRSELSGDIVLIEIFTV